MNKEKIIATIAGILMAIGVIALIVFALNKANEPQSQLAGVPINQFVTGTNTSASVATSNTAIATVNTARQYLIIVNDGSFPVYLGLGATAAVNKGIRLNASGGSYEINQDNLFTGAVNGIAVGGTSVVTVFEK